jgi:hypothetical protein
VLHLLMKFQYNLEVWLHPPLHLVFQLPYPLPDFPDLPLPILSCQTGQVATKASHHTGCHMHHPQAAWQLSQSHLCRNSSSQARQQMVGQCSFLHFRESSSLHLEDHLLEVLLCGSKVLAGIYLVSHNLPLHDRLYLFRKSRHRPYSSPGKRHHPHHPAL